MIKQLSAKYQKSVASVLFALFYLNTALASFEHFYNYNSVNKNYYSSGTVSKAKKNNNNPVYFPEKINTKTTSANKNISNENRQKNQKQKYNEPAIGGPSQPEMTAFKSVGVDNMVNLFNGDFNYNIPLLDVGGYPVNIFYDGGVGMEQEASWVGLGWNINPGTVSRNMRGVPDDFNGEEKLVQTQDMKPNITWGVNIGADLELMGIKAFEKFSGSVGANVGISFNNYLGPAIETGLKGSTSLSIGSKAGSEKSSFSAGASLSINASSRSGVSFSPSLSLTAKAFTDNKGSSIGFGSHLSTSYNSRTGIKGIQLSEQMSFNYNTAEDNKDGTTSQNLRSGGGNLSTSISFAKPSYVPSIRMPLTNKAWSGRFQLGAGVFGLVVDVEAEVSKQSSRVAAADKVQTKPLVGYLYLENAKNNPNAVMDFTRFNDNEVTPTTPIISVPQYSYDVFSIQGEGTGGSIRAYRNDDGYVRDNKTGSRDESFGLGGDVGVPGHYGANFNIVKTPTTIGEWNVGNKLRNISGFQTAAANSSFENVYFRNPGETSVLAAGQYNKIGGTDLVRFKLGGTDKSPTIEPLLERFTKAGTTNGTSSFTAVNPPERKKRTQVISFLNAEEAAIIGLDKTIKSYDNVNLLDNDKNLNYNEFNRYETSFSDPLKQYRRKHHISQINVTEANGQRYVYGIPVYNILQKDFTFTVPTTIADREADKVDFNSDNPGNATSVPNKDGYIQKTETPAYAHSFLLSGLLSPDYVDVTNNGITEDDLGNAVKFNYNRIKEGAEWARSKWRTPLTNDMKANFNAGKRTEIKDDKGIISYGERESWFLHSIESKTMIAFFKLENRNDGKGASEEFMGIDNNDNSSQLLRQINLYNKADLKKNGLQNAKPIKTVHFEYTYNLCKGTTNNTNANEGKLTLEKIYFTFNGKTRANQNQYVFAYGNTANVPPSATENPDYAFNASDRWGTYKPASQNPNSLRNADYPYPLQNKIQADANAGAWLLKKILIPSGGQIEVNYESDDYAFVQNKRAAVMTKVLGFGETSTAAATPFLYSVYSNDIKEHDYVFIQVADACATDADVKQKYLLGVEQLAFKLMVKMPDGYNEYINSYATFGSVSGTDFGVYNADASHKTIWIKLNRVDGMGPLSLTAIEFLREQLPGQAYPGFDVQGEPAPQQIGDMFAGWLDGLAGAFKNPVKHLRENSFAMEVDLNACFVRLNDPDGYKYGGGYRVKSVRLKDNWRQMNSNALYTSEYGQEYDYTTKEIFNGVERTISSGVASYEPSLGGDENPFQTMVQISNKVPLGPASYGSVEMPVLDAFFPAPSVGYSKVTVRSIKKGTPNPNQKPKSGIGKQVTEYYTAKDFPTYYSYTPLDLQSDKQASSKNLGIFFYKYSFDSRAMSQGFIIATNDMHGKMKSQASYPENDENTPLNFTQNFYSNTGEKGLAEEFDFVYASEGGTIKKGNMGVDIELMTDTREFTVKGISFDIQAQLDLFPVFGIAPWFAFIWPVAGTSENYYRAVTTTKVISYHSILDSVLVIDKGSMVSTKNLVYDAETGSVIVNRTNNEFKKSIYSTNYPAYWAYSGMGLAYKNIDVKYTNVNFLDGKIVSGNISNNIFESGDELLITNPGSAAGCTPAMQSPEGKILIWALDPNKNNSPLTNTNPDYIFIDALGKPYNRTGVSFRIVRSGHRNMLGASVASFTSMSNPLVGTSPNIKLELDPIPSNNLIVAASAMEYKEKWQVDNDVIYKFTDVTNPLTCVVTPVPDCNGYLEKSINPYVKGLLGTFRTLQSKVFYNNRKEVNPTIATNIAANGFLDNFNLYWNFNGVNNLIPDANPNSKWVFQSQITRLNSKGLELETKDALNIYTAAQYGFNKTTPVAIVNNSRYNEMFNEGFEDKDYNETLNGAVINPCLKKHIDFTNGDNIINANTNGFSAHSGKNVMLVNNGTTTKTLNTSPIIADEYPLNFTTETTTNLANPGGNFDGIFSSGSSTGYFQNSFGNINNGDPSPLIMNTSVFFNINNGTGYRDCEFTTTQYTTITSAGTYTFNMLITPPFVPGGTVTRYDFGFQICDLNGVPVPSGTYTISNYYGPPAGDVLSVYLCPGNYLIKSSCIQVIYSGESISGTHFGYSCSGLLGYKDLTTANGCTFTKPIAATPEMLNPIFSPQANKKMLFSAWVREDCATPCNKQTYSNSGVTVGFNNGGSVAFIPSGPIIEGWQKVEGVFTAPPGASQMNIAFTNAGGQPIYFDDIRIHPYNANMKSYVYDPVNLRLIAELDANNYASFYEYDNEGTLIRTKVETREGIKTIKETRSAKQKNINTIQ